MSDNWRRAALKQLTDAGLSWEHAAIAIGLLTEIRMDCDRAGYVRGYNDGWEDSEKQIDWDGQDRRAYREELNNKPKPSEY